MVQLCTHWIAPPYGLGVAVLDALQRAGGIVYWTRTFWPGQGRVITQRAWRIRGPATGEQVPP